MLQCVAVYLHTVQRTKRLEYALCYSLLLCVAACCSVLQYALQCPSGSSFISIDSYFKRIHHTKEFVCCSVLQCVAVYCSVLTHSATHCESVHDVEFVYTPTFIYIYFTCNTHCNALQRTAAHCSALQHTAAHCSALQHTAAHCSAPQRTATHCNALQRTATHCDALQHCNALQRALKRIVCWSGAHR